MTHYEILGVKKDATLNEIKSAWKKLVLQFHPDRNAGLEKEFFTAKNAFEIISDPQKRKQYDLELAIKAQPIYDHFDVFKNIANSPGRDLEKVIQITLEEVTTGVIKKLNVESNQDQTCSKCQGKRMTPGSYIIPCGSCAGTGKKFSLFQNSGDSKCPVCFGHGDIPRIPCNQCRGKGFTKVEKSIEIKIPAGIETGQRLKLNEMGGPGDPPGDLFILIEVINNPNLEIKNKDVHVKELVPWHLMLLGGYHNITILNIKYEIQIPTNSNSGTIIRKPGAGLPVLNGKGNGDLYITIHADLPMLKTKRAIKLLEELIDEVSH